MSPGKLAWVTKPSPIPMHSSRSNLDHKQAGGFIKLLLLCRPYERLQKYYIVDDRKTLLWKMSTQKQMQCSGEHCLKPGELGTFR